MLLLLNLRLLVGTLINLLLFIIIIQVLPVESIIQVRSPLSGTVRGQTLTQYAILVLLEFLEDVAYGLLHIELIFVLKEIKVVLHLPSPSR